MGCTPARPRSESLFFVEVFAGPRFIFFYALSCLSFFYTLPCVLRKRPRNVFREVPSFVLCRNSLAHFAPGTWAMEGALKGGRVVSGFSPFARHYVRDERGIYFLYLCRGLGRGREDTEVLVRCGGEPLVVVEHAAAPGACANFRWWRGICASFAETREPSPDVLRGCLWMSV